MDPTFITSRQNPLVKKLYKLATKSASYLVTSEVWLEGEHLCQAYLEKIGLPSVVVCNYTAYERNVFAHLVKAKDTFFVLDDSLFKQMSGLQSATGIGYLILVDDNRQLMTKAPTIVLDRLQDPGNVGNILRSAAAFGFHQVLALKGTCALWSPKVLRAGMGAHFSLKLSEQLDISDIFTYLQIPMIATSSHTSTMLHKAKLPWPCAWILGNEGQGIDLALLSKSDLTVCIEQPGGEESLNVATAASICMYETIRQNNFNH